MLSKHWGSQRPSFCPNSDIHVVHAYRLFDFFKELPSTVVKLRPKLMAVFREDVPLEQILNVKQWQMSIVFLTVIAKKYKVSKMMAAQFASHDLMCDNQAVYCPASRLHSDSVFFTEQLELTIPANTAQH